MSQDLRTYHTANVDGTPDEASRVGVTACVGPEGRGVQFTLSGLGCTAAYARLTEAQVRDLIRVLGTRINPDAKFEATGIEADCLHVGPDGVPLQVSGAVPDRRGGDRA